MTRDRLPEDTLCEGTGESLLLPRAENPATRMRSRTS